MAFIAILLLSIAAPEFRGRIMGLRSLAVYPLLFGSIISGALADAFGAPTAAVINAAVGGLLILVLALWLPNLHRGQAHRQL